MPASADANTRRPANLERISPSWLACVRARDTVCDRRHRQRQGRVVQREKRREREREGDRETDREGEREGEGKPKVGERERDGVREAREAYRLLHSTLGGGPADCADREPASVCVCCASWRLLALALSRPPSFSLISLSPRLPVLRSRSRGTRASAVKRKEGKSRFEERHEGRTRAGNTGTWQPARSAAPPSPR